MSWGEIAMAIEGNELLEKCPDPRYIRVLPVTPFCEKQKPVLRHKDQLK